MSPLTVIVAVGVFVIALLWLGVGIAGLRGALPRNRWVGVRTEDTLASAETFRVANRVAAPGMLGAAAILCAGGLLTLGVHGGWSVMFGLGALVPALIIVGIVGGYGVAASRLVPVEEHACACCSHDADPVAHTAAPTATSTNAAADNAAPNPASDCAESSCVSCTLRGVCSNEVGAHSPQA